MSSVPFLYWFHDRRHFRRFLWGLTLVSLLSGIGALFIPQAWAAAFSCTNATANGNLFDQDTLTQTVNTENGNAPYSITVPATVPNGDPTAGGAGAVCNNTLGIIGTIICFFKSSIGQSLSSMYCGIQYEMLGPISIAIELFIVLFGVAVMTGITSFTVKDSVIALVKMALIWTFATNAAWGIGIAYSFFMSLAEQGSQLILGTTAANAGGAAGNGGGAFLTQPDPVFFGVFNELTTGNPNGTAGTGPSGILNLPGTVTGTNLICGIWIAAAIVMCILFLPFVAGFIITLVLQYFMLYARAALGYLTALVLISFLFILSPIFMSMALFQVTRPLFEQWLKYLTSFSLQMIIVFGFLVLLNMVPLGAFFNEILSLLRPYNYSFRFNNSPWTYTGCTFCQYAVDYTKILGQAGPPPITCAAGTTLLPPWQAMVQPDLVTAIVSQVVALWLLGSILKDFMSQAPQFASDLAGGLPFAAMLGGSAAQVGGAGAIEYVGLDELDQTISSIPQKLSYAAQTDTWKKIARPIAIGTVAMTIAAGLKKNNSSQSGSSGNDGHYSLTKALKGTGSQSGSSAAGRHYSLADALRGAGSQSGSSATGGYSLTGALRAGNAPRGGSSSGPGVSRPIVGMSTIRSLAESQLTAQSDFVNAQDNTQENYLKLQEARVAVESYKGTDPEKKSILATALKDANTAYLTSNIALYDSQRRMKTLYDSQRAMLGARLGATSGVIASQPQGAVFYRSSSGSGSGASAGTSSSAVSGSSLVSGASSGPSSSLSPGSSANAGYSSAAGSSGQPSTAAQNPVISGSAADLSSSKVIENMRDRANASIQAVELQISVMQHLLPAGRIGEAQKLLDKVANDFNYAQTPEDLDDIFRQLYTIQLTLS